MPIYSFKVGHEFALPKAPEYLMEEDGRHYIKTATSITIPVPAAADLVQHDLSTEAKVRLMLEQKSLGVQAVQQERARLYPDLGDQAGAILKTLEAIAEAVPSLVLPPEMKEILDKWKQVKAAKPKPEFQ